VDLRIISLCEFNNVLVDILYKKLNKFSYISISKFTLTNKKTTKNMGNLMQDSLAVHYISVFSKTVIVENSIECLMDMPLNFKLYKSFKQEQK